MTNINQKIKDNGGDPAMLKSVKLSSLNIDITSGQNYDKIDYAIANIMKSGLTTKKIAYAEKSDFVKGSTTHSFKNQYEELADYVKTDTFRMEFRGYNNDFLPPMTFNAKVILDVTVGPTK